MANAYGLAPLPWQQTILNDWLALDDNGKLLNSLCVVPVPRQNGKTGIIEPRETWGLVHRGEWILHTAHEYQTALIGFNRLRAKFGERKNDPHARFPELNALVKRYTTSSNQMVLDLKNGAHIEFRTRGNNDDVGRGGTFDLVVVDEAQSYTDEQDAALSPLNSAAPTGSPQFIMAGTVPKPTSLYKGEKFASIRASLHHDPYTGACIHEWAAGEIGDVADIERWYEYNPSLGYQLLESALLTDSRKMNKDTFAREHLGWWPELANTSTAIHVDDWTACKVDNPEKAGVVVYAVKFSPDGSTGVLAACYKPSNAKPFIYVVDSRSLSEGIGWFVDMLAPKAESAAQIVIDGQSNAQTLNERLLSAGVPSKVIIRPRTGDVIAACSSLANAVKERQVTHYGQPALDNSATRTRKRRIGTTGGWGFQSTEEADATLIEACALAFWCAMTTKRKPGRKAVVL
jgi:phage terminase large subunit-like protein